MSRRGWMFIGHFTVTVFIGVYAANLDRSLIGPVEEVGWVAAVFGLVLAFLALPDWQIGGPARARPRRSTRLSARCRRSCPFSPCNYVEDQLESVTYQRTDGWQQTLAIDEVMTRAQVGELRPPIKILAKPTEADLRRPQEKLTSDGALSSRRPRQAACRNR